MRRVKFIAEDFIDFAQPAPMSRVASASNAPEEAASKEASSLLYRASVVLGKLTPVHLDHVLIRALAGGVGRSCVDA